MNKNRSNGMAIRNHSDLMIERKRLENQVVIHKALLIREFEMVRGEVTERLQPAVHALDTIRNIRQVIQSPPVLMLLGAFILKKVLDVHVTPKQTTTSWLPALAQLLLQREVKRTSSHK